MHPRLSTSTVYLPLTDIEGSTQLWEKYPQAMKTALARHDSILRQAVETNNGHVIKTTGDGILAAFDAAVDGLAAAMAAQLELVSQEWDEIRPQPVGVRMGLHTGEPQLRACDWY